jgi:(p)ppGpp synthase/HD superfamily hydrolase
MTDQQVRDLFRAAVTMILEANRLAAHFHRDQFRKDSSEPYINHPIRIAEQAHKYGLSPVAICAALLHDTVEDTEATHKDIKLAMGDEVAGMVHRLTKWWGDSDTSDQVKHFKHHYYAGIMSCQETLCVKLLDRADNVADFARMAQAKPDAKWPLNYYRKTLREFTEEHQLLMTCKEVAVRDHLNKELSNLAKILTTNGHTLKEV